MAEKDGTLRLQLLDVYRNSLGEKVDILLRHQTLSDSRVIRAVDASKQIAIGGLYSVPQGLYRVEVDPPSYLPVSQFVNVESSRITDREVVFPVNPKKVARVAFPDSAGLIEDAQTLLNNSDSVLGFEGKKGDDLYTGLDNIRRAGLLNIVAKCHRTRLSNDAIVSSYVQKLREIRGDRFFALVPKELREETKNSIPDGIFEKVDETLHHPPVGFEHAGSFKTFDHYGNLQLTFFTDGKEWVADIDIDDASGLEHVFQVLRNALTGRPTHPYDIHEILVYYQELDPGYRLIVAD